MLLSPSSTFTILFLSGLFCRYRWHPVSPANPGGLRSLRKNYKVFLRIIISAALLTWLILRLDPVKIAYLIAKANPGYLFLTFIIIALGLAISAFKWHLLLKKMEHDVPIRYLLELYYIGLFFSNFLPTSIGGDVVRIKRLKDNIGKMGASFSSTFMDRFTGLTAIFLCVIAGGILTSALLPQRIWFLMTGISAAGLAASYFVFNPSVIKKVSGFALPKTAGKLDAGFFKNIEKVTACKSDFLSVLGLSLLFQFLVIIAYYFAALSLGSNVSFYYFVLFVPVVILASFIPVSLNGLGIREGTMILMFALVGMNNQIALSTGLIIYFLTLANSLIGGLLYLIEKKPVFSNEN